MLNLKRKHYPFSYLLGFIHMITIYYNQYNHILLTLQLIILMMKSKKEGFRFSIYFYGISVILYFMGFNMLSFAIIIFYQYLSFKLINYELPDSGSPVGHLYIKGSWLAKYKEIPELAIYYPADEDDTKFRKIGFPWLKVKDYASRMDDTAKKDVKRKRRVPYLFFKIVVTQFYKFIMYVYEGAKINIKFGDTKENTTRFQVIVLSHGLASHCDGYSVVARYLAQQGHIVFVPEHIENIRNIYESDELNRVYRQGQLEDRVRTITQVLDIIYNENEFSNLFKNADKQILPDYKEISIIGHSFGGSIALAMSQRDSRITGTCILYDPCVYVFPDDFKVQLHIPLLSINADDFYQRLYAFMDNDRRLENIFKQIEGPIQDHCLNIYIKDQQHADFSDIPIIWNGESGLYSISKNVHEVHLRFGIILLLTKIFLQESKKYHEIKHVKREVNGNEQLQQTVLKEVSKQFGINGSKLFRWSQQ